jgi:hypothetical protein
MSAPAKRGPASLFTEGEAGKLLAHLVRDLERTDDEIFTADFSTKRRRLPPALILQALGFTAANCCRVG